MTSKRNSAKNSRIARANAESRTCPKCGRKGGKVRLSGDLGPGDITTYCRFCDWVRLKP